VALAAVLLVSDYVGVAEYGLPSRFCYERSYYADSTGREEIVYRTPFYDIVRHDPDGAHESYEIRSR
jgi:hypothetical protein